MASVHAATKGLSTMHSAWHIALSVVLLASLPAAVAHAEKPASSGKEQKAKHHFHVAQTFKELGEYDKAAEEFLKAYELYKDPAFFFNAGEMYRLAGDHKLAVKYFKLYLVEHPNGRVASAAKGTIRKLQPKADLQITKEKLASELARRKAEEQSAATARARREGESAGAAKARQDSAAVIPRGNADSTAEDGAEDGSWSVEKRLKVAGVATGAVGVVAVGVGAYFGFSAASNNADLETLKNDRKFESDLIDDRDSSQTAFYALAGVGIGALIGGGVLYYLGEGESESADGQTAFSLLPIVTPDSASISCSGSF